MYFVLAVPSLHDCCPTYYTPLLRLKNGLLVSQVCSLLHSPPHTVFFSSNVLIFIMMFNKANVFSTFYNQTKHSHVCRMKGLHIKTRKKKLFYPLVRYNAESYIENHTASTYYWESTNVAPFKITINVQQCCGRNWWWLWWMAMATCWIHFLCPFFSN